MRGAGGWWCSRHSGMHWGAEWGEFEEIKDLFVLIGEWVQLVPAAVIYGDAVRALMELMVV